MRCHSQALTVKLRGDVPLDEIHQMLAAANDWVRVLPNDRAVTVESLSPAAVTGTLDIPVGPSFVFHLDGSWRKTDDVEIPGFQVAAPFRAELLEEAQEEEDEGEFEEAEEFREAAKPRTRPASFRTAVPSHGL